MKKLLIIEDDPALSKGISIFLNEEGFETDTASDGIEGYNKALKPGIDLIILDLILPNKNGIDVCRELRENKIMVPIIILSSRKDDSDKIVGLELGADDYVTKPFNNRELLARIKAVLRRYENHDIKTIDKFSFGKITVDFINHELFNDGNLVKMSETEFNVMKYLIEHQGEVVTRNMLLDDVWGYESFPTTRTVDNYILSLRKKIEEIPSKPKYLLTIHTAGYKFKCTSIP